MHVAITQKLLSEVGNLIHHKLKPKEYRLNFGVDDIDSTFVLPSNHEIIPRIIWGKHINLQQQMPKEWLEELHWDWNDEATLNLESKINDSELNALGVKKINIQVKLKKKRNITVPPKCARFSTFPVDSEVCPEIKEFFDKKVSEEKFELKWRKVRDDVGSFLDSSKSLNAALKAWPELRAFIPAEYLERVDRKVDRKAERAEVERKLAEIDREGAVAAAALAALAA